MAVLNQYSNENLVEKINDRQAAVTKMLICEFIGGIIRLSTSNGRKLSIANSFVGIA